jgi:16S rRNA (cytidine1402-2'-O)-methyltransferase
MILNQLDQGDVALVSDAGTPLLNDPGFELVQRAIEYGYKISPIPGASAPIAALSSSGISPDKFLYLGYLPRKKGERVRALELVATLPYTLIFLEAPHRLLQSLTDILAVLGDRNISIARELTKIHEEILRGTCAELIKHFSVHDPRGEITLVISGAPVQAIWTLEQVNATTQRLLEQNKTVAEIAREVSSLSGWSRRKVYQLIIQKNNDTPERGER